MHIEFLVEEESQKVALDLLLPKIIPDVSCRILVFNGKRDLLKKLPERLRGYRSWIPDDYRLLILIDEDRQDCHQLKAELEQIAAQSGYPTRSQSPDAYTLVNRIVVEELEAWFFGDVEAIVAAYPKVSLNLAEQKPYRDPDRISGGTWEALERVLKEKGYHRGGLEKLRAAKEIATHMQPERNRSQSFQLFRHTLLEIVAMAGE